MEIEVGPVSELPPGSVRVVGVGSQEVAVFSTSEGLFALDNRCAHKGGPLAEGWVEGGVVTCPWHWWRYELASGRNRSAGKPVAPHPVTVRGGMVVVEVPEPEPEPASIRDRLLQHARDWERPR